MQVIRTHPSGVLLSERAFDVGLAEIRKRAEQAAPWFVVAHGERFAVMHRETAKELRGPSGRLSTFGDDGAAQKAADKANAEGGAA